MLGTTEFAPDTAAPAAPGRGREAIDLWDLCVWAYQRQRVEQMTGQDVSSRHDRAGGPRGGGDSCAAVAAIAAVGCAIDGGRWKGLGAKAHPDAVALHEAVLALGADRPLDAEIIAQQARAGEVPEISTVRPRLVAVRDGAAGRAPATGAMPPLVREEWVPALSVTELRRVERAYRKRFGVAVGPLKRTEPGFAYRFKCDRTLVKVLHCPVVAYPPQAMIDAVNGIYAFWHAAMGRLLTRMAGVPLRRYRITGFGAKAMPWRENP